LLRIRYGFPHPFLGQPANPTSFAILFIAANNR
jgi:hypothetical protein